MLEIFLPAYPTFHFQQMSCTHRFPPSKVTKRGFLWNCQKIYMYVSDNLGLIFFKLKLPSLSWKDAAYWRNGRCGAGKHEHIHLRSTLLKIEGEKWLKLIRKVSQCPKEMTQQQCYHNTTLILTQISKTSGNVALPSTPVSDEHLLTYEGAAGGQNEKLYL